MPHLRNAGENDLELLRKALFEAAFWQPEMQRPQPTQALAEPELARYVEGFGRPGDFGVIAEADEGGQALGAAWWRRFSTEARGYGFVDEATPEITVAVLPDHRGQGTGTALLRALLGEARERGLDQLCLSVERDNPAVGLYERLGFRPVATVRNALTMVVDVGANEDRRKRRAGHLEGDALPAAARRPDPRRSGPRAWRARAGPP